MYPERDTTRKCDAGIDEGCMGTCLVSSSRLYAPAILIPSAIMIHWQTVMGCWVVT